MNPPVITKFNHVSKRQSLKFTTLSIEIGEPHPTKQVK